jgi:hypothetical protein
VVLLLPERLSISHKSNESAGDNPVTWEVIAPLLESILTLPPAFKDSLVRPRRPVNDIVKKRLAGSEACRSKALINATGSAIPVF